MNTVISVKIDKETKEAAQELAKSMGLSLSTLINSYLKQVIVTRRVELYAPEQMTPKLEKLLAPIDADIKAGRNLSPAFSSVKEMRAWLNKNKNESNTPPKLRTTTRKLSQKTAR